MMEQGRIEEFTHNGENFIYIDLSDFKTNEDFIRLMDITGPKIAKYPPYSLYTITNVENIRIDSESKEIVARYMVINKPYVKYGALIGLDGVKKLLIRAMFTLSGRKNMLFAFTREQAIDLLLNKEMNRERPN